MYQLQSFLSLFLLKSITCKVAQSVCVCVRKIADEISIYRRKQNEFLLLKNLLFKVTVFSTDQSECRSTCEEKNNYLPWDEKSKSEWNSNFKRLAAQERPFKVTLTYKSSDFRTMGYAFGFDWPRSVFFNISTWRHIELFKDIERIVI